MTLIGCWVSTGTSTQNSVGAVGDNETTPLRPDSLLGEFTKAGRVRQTSLTPVRMQMVKKSPTPADRDSSGHFDG